MDGEFPRPPEPDIIDLQQPVARSLPLVLASPHSGAEYPADFLTASRLDPVALRRSEDSFVDELFGAGPRLGSPLLSARFPRAYIDVNREAYELDPSMFADALPQFVNAGSPRVRMGLGTIARIVASGEEIYANKLRFAEAHAEVGVAEMLMRKNLEQVREWGTTRVQPTREQRATIRRNIVYAAKLCTQATNRLVDGADTSAIRISADLHRQAADVRTGASHRIFQPEETFLQFSAVRWGLEPLTPI